MKKEATKEIIERIDYLINEIDNFEINDDDPQRYIDLNKEFDNILEEYDLQYRLYEENGKVGIKDFDGEILVPAIYTRIPSVPGYADGRPGVMVYDENNKCSIVELDGKGTPRFPFEFNDLFTFNYAPGFLGCVSNENGKEEITLRNIAGETRYIGVIDGFGECFNDVCTFAKDGKYGIFTDWGTFVEPVFDNAYDAYGLLRVEKDGVLGHVSVTGEFIPDDEDESWMNEDVIKFYDSM